MVELTENTNVGKNSTATTSTYKTFLAQNKVIYTYIYNMIAF